MEKLKRFVQFAVFGIGNRFPSGEAICGQCGYVQKITNKRGDPPLYCPECKHSGGVFLDRP